MCVEAPQGGSALLPPHPYPSPPLTPRPHTPLLRPMPLLPSLPRHIEQLRVAQVTGGAASKVGKIKQVRKNIARILTVINTKARDAYKKEVKGYKNNKVPKTLRQKKTRAIRRALTPKEVRTLGGTHCAAFARAPSTSAQRCACLGYTLPYLTHPLYTPFPYPTARRGDLEAEEEAQLCPEEVRSQGIN